MNENRFFNPPSLEWQQKLCSKFAVAHTETRDLYNVRKKIFIHQVVTATLKVMAIVCFEHWRLLFVEMKKTMDLSDN